MEKLLIIKTEEQYYRALDRLDNLFDAEPNTPEGDELETLMVLIKLYEDNNFQLPTVDPIEVIEFYLEQRGVLRSDLIGVIGDKTSVSKIFRKKRKLTLEMIRNVGDFLKIPVNLLIPDYNLNL
ncbi:MAG: transcriptional regulator [Marinifilaceae bacterium]|jgi:HTH-type transcriptional regulator/antitoxin HigA|nr:transcriptional regulator [Marinilabiliaceae bacterium JC040]MCT4599626.1 transcriptional regulator [Marinifilaceae bacterium]